MIYEKPLPQWYSRLSKQRKKVHKFLEKHYHLSNEDYFLRQQYDST